ncbi:MAG: hypothetical protein JNL70_07835 [Saprospiraceae bacterium]|nr:hypothetical protein [Saprospiraceae bacterium]
MDKKNLLITIIVFFYTFLLQAQSDTLNRRQIRPFGISCQIGGPTYLMAVNLDYFVSKNFSLEVGAGAIGYYGGVKAYFGKKTWNSMPFIGATYSNITFGGDDGGIFPYLYLPLGYHFVGKKGLNASLEIATISPDIGLFGQLRIGYRFLKKKKTK